MATDQDLIVRLAARFPLEKLQKVKDAADPNDPDMPLLDGAIKRLQGQRDKVAQQYERDKLPEPVNPTLGKVARVADRAGKFLGIIPQQDNGTADDAGSAGGVARNIGRQAEGTAAGFLNAIPFAGSALEAAGDLERTLLPGQNRFRLFPAPGGLAATEAAAPSPTTARVSGAVAGMVPGSPTAGLAAAPFKAGEALVEATPGLRAIPGAKTLGGAALGSADVAAGDAAIRRVPAIIRGEQAPPIDVTHEILAPAALGTAFAVPGATAEAATHVGPRRNINKMSPGEVARTYAANRRAGKTFEKTDEDALVAAKDEAKAAEDARVSEAMIRARADEQQTLGDADAARGVEMDELRAYGERMRGELKGRKERELARMRGEGEQELLDLERAGKEDLTRLGSEQDAELARTAAEKEDALRTRFQQQRTGAKETFDKTLQDVEQQVGGAQFETQPVLDQIREHVASFARQDTADPHGIFTGKDFDALERAGVDTSDMRELHLGVGREVAGAEKDLQTYLGEKASIRDYRNAITALQKKAESGTPLQQYAYSRVLGMLRDHLGKVDPTGLVKAANEEYRRAATARERTRGIVYGKEGEKLGEGSPEARFDSSELEDVTTPAISPQEELRGAKFFSNLGDPARARHEFELRGYGYGDLLDAMAEAKRNGEGLRAGAKQKFEDTIRERRSAQAKAEEDAARGAEEQDLLMQEQAKAEQQALAGRHTEAKRGEELASKLRLDQRKRTEDEASAEAMSGPEGELERFKQGREALERSAPPDIWDLASGAGFAGAGLHFGGRVGLALDLMAAGLLGRKSHQYLRSRAAYHLPDAEAYTAGIAPTASAFDRALEERRRQQGLLPEQLNIARLRQFFRLPEEAPAKTAATKK